MKEIFGKAEHSNKSNFPLKLKIDNKIKTGEMKQQINLIRNTARCNNYNDLAKNTFILKVSVFSEGVFRTLSNNYDEAKIAEIR